MKFTVEELKAFRGDFKAAVKALETKYDIRIDLGNIRYDFSSFRTKLEATSNSAPAPAAFTVTGDVPKIGSKIQLRGKPMVYEVVGFLPKSKKYPISITSSNGASYKISMSTYLAATKI